MRGFFALGLALFCTSAFAAPWVFDPPVAVGKDLEVRAFAHLESAGRKSIAESDGWVAITWEDNRDGASRCYVALKAPDRNSFADTLRVSGDGEAFEPAIVGLGHGRFALAWEEGGQVRARLLAADGLGKPTTLSARAAAQASLGYAQPDGLFATWSEKKKLYWQVQVARLIPGRAGGLKASRAYPIESGKVEGDQSYPSVSALNAKKLVVAWEDRRAGHTRILSSVSQNGGARFAPPQQINDAVWRGQMGGFGRGTGVMRVALSTYGSGGVAAVWADKRDFLAGYDVYVALTKDAMLTFGANEKAQDDFGNEIAQWHPAIGANRQGRIAVVWDDDRDGTPDVWLAWRGANGWSENLAVPGAFGPGVQSDPSIALDEAGNLHLAWVEKADLNSPSRIRYVLGRWVDGNK
jgi:hypothetical protein